MIKRQAFFEKRGKRQMRHDLLTADLNSTVFSTPAVNRILDKSWIFSTFVEEY
jgi:hypothetical protein